MRLLLLSPPPFPRWEGAFPALHRRDLKARFSLTLLSLVSSRLRSEPAGAFIVIARAWRRRGRQGQRLTAAPMGAGLCAQTEEKEEEGGYQFGLDIQRQSADRLPWKRRVGEKQKKERGRERNTFSVTRCSYFSPISILVKSRVKEFSAIIWMVSLMSSNIWTVVPLLFWVQLSLTHLYKLLQQDTSIDCWLIFLEANIFLD